MLALLGFATIVLFTVLVMTHRISAVAGLILIPIIFALLGGFGGEIGGMMVAGVIQSAPAAVMLVFALLYFMLMYECGLFEPFIRRILAVVGDDPVKIVMGTAFLVFITAIDGDGASAVLITVTSMYPIYRRIGLNPLIIALLLGLISPVLNWLPWGGPAARASIALDIELSDIVVPMLPAMVITLTGAFVLAYILGRSEKRRLQNAAAKSSDELEANSKLTPKPREPIEPKNFWFNLILTVAMMIGLALGVVPLPALVMAGFAIAVTVNFPNVKVQQERLKPHANAAVLLVTLILAAGAFTGILSETGMVEAMAGSLIAVIPPSWGPHFGFITAVISVPLLFILSTDSFWLGVLPILAETGAAYGVPPEVIARAGLVGMPMHSLSPLIAPIYLVATLLRTDIGSLQRFAFPWSLVITVVAIIAVMITGAVYSV